MKALVSSGNIDSYITEISDVDMDTTGEAVLKVEYSSLNYKDALGVTGKGKIYRKLPMIGGIDAAGELQDGSGKKFLVTGCGIGESDFGGFAEYLKTSADNLIEVPSKFTTKTAMILGTAGFTAGMALYRMQKNGQEPSSGPIVISGASGGVGMLACHIFNRAGYEVIAVSRKPEHYKMLKLIGASKCTTLEDLGLGSRPLESVRFGGVVDNIGGEFLKRIVPHINLFGNVASIGLASGHKLEGTVMPHILRGVSILGISSANCPLVDRVKIWQLLNELVDIKVLEKIHSDTIELENVLEKSQQMLAGASYGRCLVKL